MIVTYYAVDVNDARQISFMTIDAEVFTRTTTIRKSVRRADEGLSYKIIDMHDDLADDDILTGTQSISTTWKSTPVLGDNPGMRCVCRMEIQCDQEIYKDVYDWLIGNRQTRRPEGVVIRDISGEQQH